MWRNGVLPISLLSGTIIGAGIFSLPYAFLAAGIWASVALLCVVTSAFLIFHLLYADIVARDGDDHRLEGFARMHAGMPGYVAAIAISVVQELFTLTIYLVLSMSFARLLLGVGWEFTGMVAFWIIGSLALISKTRRVALWEAVATASIILIVAIVGVWGIHAWGKIAHMAPLLPQNIGTALIPFGLLLFAFNGRTAISTVVHYFRFLPIKKRFRLIKKSIIAGTLIPAGVYVIFVFGVVGLSSGAVSQDTITGLSRSLPLWFGIVFGALGILSLVSSYFAIGLDVKNSLRFDVGFSSAGAIALTFAIPLLLFLLGFQNFIWLVEIVGGFFIGLEGVLMLVLWHRSRKKNNTSLLHIPFPLIMFVWAVFIASVCYTVITRIV